MNLFIESIEGGTYLAAFEQNNQRDYLKDRNHNTLTFHCISEIKTFLAGRSFERVTLRQSTPYDEMCGQSMGGESLELELEW